MDIYFSIPILAIIQVHSRKSFYNPNDIYIQITTRNNDLVLFAACSPGSWKLDHGLHQKAYVILSDIYIFSNKIPCIVVVNAYLIEAQGTSASLD